MLEIICIYQKRKYIQETKIRQDAHTLAQQGLVLKNKDDFVFEYDLNQTISTLDLVEGYNTVLDSAEIVVTCDTEFVDQSEVGKKQVNYKITSYDEYGEEVYKESRRLLFIYDSKAPIISIKDENIELIEGESWKAIDNIITVYDEIDGELDYIKKSEIPVCKINKENEPEPGSTCFYDEGWFYIDSEVKNNKPGVYKVTISACDIHGNKTEKSFEVTVKEKPVSTVANYSGNVNNSGTTSSSFTIHSGGTNNANQLASSPSSNTSNSNGNSSIYNAPAENSQSAPDVDTSIPSGTFRSYAEANAWANAQLDADIEAWYAGTLANPRTGFYADAFYTAAGIEYWVVTFY